MNPLSLQEFHSAQQRFHQELEELEAYSSHYWDYILHYIHVNSIGCGYMTFHRQLLFCSPEKQSNILFRYSCIRAAAAHDSAKSDQNAKPNQIRMQNNHRISQTSLCIYIYICIRVQTIHLYIIIHLSCKKPTNWDVDDVSCFTHSQFLRRKSVLFNTLTLESKHPFESEFAMGGDDEVQCALVELLGLNELAGWQGVVEKNSPKLRQTIPARSSKYAEL